MPQNGPDQTDLSHSPARVDPPATLNALAERLGRRVFRIGIGALWVYGWLVFPWTGILGGSAMGRVVSVAILFAGLTAIVLASRRWLSDTRMLDTGLIGLLFLLVMFIGDVALAIRDNWTRAGVQRDIAADARNSDRTVWHGELYPRMYVPAGQPFSLYKPNVRLTGDTYGERYVSSMLGSPTLAESVLERRHLSYFIGPHGLRELEPLAGSRIFALGDSFVFGFATDEGKIWPDLLGAALGEPVFNLGVSATGPRAQFQLLDYLLKTNSDMRVGRLLWMIFEGNDLENSYDAVPVASGRPGVSALVAGTVLEPLMALPERVRSQSMIRKLARGELSISSGDRRFGQYRVDGIDISVPLFHSNKFGYRLFSPADVEAATQSREYVLNHPNRSRLDQTFRDMRALSEKAGFPVTVIIAPSDARLYGAAFDQFPALSPQPHFVDYVAQLAAEMQFSVVNLLPMLEPLARTELLYYRDDHHWNERGNEVVAALIQAALQNR